MFMPKKMLALEDKFDLLEDRLFKLHVEAMDVSSEEIEELGWDIEFGTDGVCHEVHLSK